MEAARIPILADQLFGGSSSASSRESTPECSSSSERPMDGEGLQKRSNDGRSE